MRIEFDIRIQTYNLQYVLHIILILNSFIVIPVCYCKRKTISNHMIMHKTLSEERKYLESIFFISKLR